MTQTNQDATEPNHVPAVPKGKTFPESDAGKETAVPTIPKKDIPPRDPPLRAAPQKGKSKK